jgi:hypothetical protein
MVFSIATHDALASHWTETGDPEPNPSSLFVCLIDCHLKAALTNRCGLFDIYRTLHAAVVAEDG